MKTHTPRRNRGFSLVELMVSVVIGLLALLFATRLIVSGEKNKDAAVGGSDSMQNGMLALFSLSGDATEAGWGLNDPMVAGCDTVFADAKGYVLPTAQRGGANFTPLAAAVIQSNGADPDVISFNSGTSQAGAGSVKLTADYTVGNTVGIDSRGPYAFSDGDVVVVAPLTPGSGRCTLFQVSGFAVAPVAAGILVGTGGAYRFNPLAGLPTPYKQNLAYIYNLGTPALLHFHTWSVANGVLLLRATELAGAELAGVSVTDNVVSIKAQYGFDARLPGPKPYDPNPGADGMQITTWSSTMIDADHDTVIGSPGDFQRVAAVRIAVVARSKNAEKPNSAGQCSATTVRPTVFAGVAPVGVAAAPVQVNVAVPGDSVSWQCYRYRVFETIVQIRNSQWRL